MKAKYNQTVVWEGSVSGRKARIVRFELPSEPLSYWTTLVEFQDASGEWDATTSDGRSSEVYCAAWIDLRRQIA